MNAYKAFRMGCSSSKQELPTNALETLLEHSDAINCMSVSEDKSLLVTGSEDKTARMWSTMTPDTECIGVLQGHTSYITCCTIVDTFVMTGSADGCVRKWSMTTCECVHVYSGHESRISRIICTGEFVFSSSSDKTAKAWLYDVNGSGTKQKDCIRTFKGHSRGIYPLIFIPSDDLPTEAYRGRLNINPSDLLITGSADNTARAWSFDTADTIAVFEGHNGPITCMAATSTGKILFTGSGDKMIMSWNITSGHKLKEFRGHANPIICLKVVDRLLYSGSSDMTAKCWVIELGENTQTYNGHKHSVACLHFDDGVLYTGSTDSTARAFDAKTGNPLRMFRGHQGAITTLARVGTKLYTGSEDATIRVWDLTGITNGIVKGTSIQQQTAKIQKPNEVKPNEIKRQAELNEPSTSAY